MIKNYLIPSLITASALGLTACGGGTTTKPGTNTAPVANISGETAHSFTLNQGLSLSGTSSSDKEDGSLSHFKWSGDLFGASDNAESISINPNAAGSYSITLTVTDSGGETAIATYNFTVTDSDNTPPKAIISGDTASNVEVGQSISLSAASSTDKEDGSVTSVMWISALLTGSNDAENINITFTEAGPEVVKLIVTDSKGATHSTQLSFNVVLVDPSNLTPTATITGADSLNVFVGDKVTLSGADSIDPDGSISTYEWQSALFSSTETKLSLDLEFTTAGKFPVTLTVTDNGGKTATKTIEFTVQKEQCLSCNDPIALISPAGKQSIDVGKTLSLSAANSSGEELTYLWSNGKTTKDIELSFAQAGTQSLTLTVTDKNNYSSEITVAIEVTAVTTSNTIIYFKNDAAYVKPMLHFWNVNAGIADSKWPGEEMTNLGNDWFSYDFGAKDVAGDMLFHDFGQDAPGNLVLDPTTPCYQNSQFVTMAECGYQPVDLGDIQAPSVTATPPSGSYPSNQDIILSITDNEDSAPKLYFTIDGSPASKNSTPYSKQSITASDDVETGVDLTINTYAIDAEGNDVSNSFTYTIGQKIVPVELGDNIFAEDCSSQYDDYSNNLRIYQVMVESFIDGDQSIGYGSGYGTSHHQGDLQGIINSLDYVKELGMNAIWLTPVFDSEGGDDMDATGYFTRNYFKIDPKWGDMAKAKELVETAHTKGLYVFFDGVFGHHKGGVPSSPNGNTPQGSSNPVSYPGSLPYYTEVATYWINELKIDGWRLDQAYQVPVEAWRDIRKAVVETSAKVTYTNSEGKTVHPLGYMVGEIWDSETVIKDKGYGTETNRGLCSNFDFPARYNLVQTFAGEEHMAENGKKDLPASNLKGAFDKNASNPSNVHPNLMITNHDLVRFGDLLQRAGLAGPDDDEYWLRHKATFGFMGAYTGPITVYYGDEIGQEVADFANMESSNGRDCTRMNYCDDHVSRDSGRIEGLNHSGSAKENDLRAYVTKLMTVRAQEPALYDGERTHLSVGDAATIYADLKQKDGTSILYITNKSGNAQTVTVSTTEMQASGTLSDLIDDSTVSESSGNYSITMAPWQVRYLKAN